MATPVGHSIAGYICYSVLDRRPFGRMARWKIAIIFIIFANVPDLDFIPGFFMGNINMFHQTMTHSIGFLFICLVLLWIFVRKMPKEQLRLWLIGFGACFASHLLLDFFAFDGSAPYGAAFLWPFSMRRFISPVPIFSDVHHRTIASIFSLHNLVSIFKEMLLLVPVAILIVLIKKRNLKNSRGECNA